MTNDNNGEVQLVDFATLVAMIEKGEVETLVGYTTSGTELYAAPKAEYMTEIKEVDEEEIKPFLNQQRILLSRPQCCANGFRHNISQRGGGSAICFKTTEPCQTGDRPCGICRIVG